MLETVSPTKLNGVLGCLTGERIGLLQSCRSIILNYEERALEKIDRKSYIEKANPNEILCHGLGCSLRDRCRKYNLEPNEKQQWKAGYPQTIGKNTVLCIDLEMIVESNKEAK